MNLFLEIITIAIFIVLVKECFTIHMGLFCAYSNVYIFLITNFYTMIIVTLSKLGIIEYNSIHCLIISFITIAIFVIKHIIDNLIYKRTHPRDDVRLKYESIILNELCERDEDVLNSNYLFGGYYISDAFTSILKFYDLKEESLRKIITDILDKVPVVEYSESEYEKIQSLLKEYPIESLV